MHKIFLEHAGGAGVVAAAGELDAFVAEELTHVLESALRASQVVVDLTSVSFMDSTALGVVVRAARRAEEHHRGFRVVLPAGTARRIFELTTLDRVLPVAPTRGEALAELDGGAPPPAAA